MQVFVLGMHRSGTSALARVLNLMGLYFGGERVGTGRNLENEKGFWERRDVRTLNDTILFSARCDWDCVSAFEPDKLPDQKLSEYRAVVADIVMEMDAHRPWFVKEPRLCLLFPIWRTVLEMPFCIHIHRNPLEVAHSLKRRNGIPVRAGLALWEFYNRRALQATSGLPRQIVSYADLLEDPVATVGTIHEALAQFGEYGLRVPSSRELGAFLDDGLRHHRRERTSLRAVATASQLALYDALTGDGQIDAAGVEAMPGKCIDMLARHEETVDVEERIRSWRASNAQRSQPNTEMQLALARLDLRHARSASEDARAKLQALEQRLAKSQGTERELSARLAGREERIRAADQAAAQGQETRRQLAARLSERELETRQLATKLREHESKARDLTTKVAVRDERIRTYRRTTEQVLTARRELASKLREHESNARDLTTKIAVRDERIRTYRRTSEQVLTERRELAQELRDLATKLAVRDEQIRSSGAAIEQTQAERRQLAQKLSARESDIQALLRTKDRLEQSRSALERDRERLRQSGEQLRQQADERERARRALEAERQQLRAQRDTLHGYKANVQSEASAHRDSARKTLRTLDAEIALAKRQAVELEELTSQLQHGIRACLRSRRWRLGNGLLSIHPRSLIRGTPHSIRARLERATTAHHASKHTPAKIARIQTNLLENGLPRLQPGAVDSSVGTDAARRLEVYRMLFERWAALGRRRAEVATQREFADQLAVIVEALAATRRWRLGDALLSVHHRLLGRGRPATAVDAMSALIVEYRSDKTAVADRNPPIDSVDPESTTPPPAAKAMRKDSPSDAGQGQDAPQAAPEPTRARPPAIVVEEPLAAIQRRATRRRPFASAAHRDRVDVVVCVHNALEDVRQCLGSVLAKSTVDFQLVIVNDGSDAETTRWLRSFAASSHANAELIETEGPLGYTRAANLGIKASSSDNVVLLNSDTIVPRLWLESLLACMHSDTSMGIVGPLSNAASWQSVPDVVDGQGGWAINELPPGYNVDEYAELVHAVSSRQFPHVDFVNGFCFMISRRVIDRIGLLDEVGFPRGYGEENDYCLRARDAGFELAIADQCFVYHGKSKSFGHAERAALAKAGGKALLDKHGARRIENGTARLKDSVPLKTIRNALQARFQPLTATRGNGGNDVGGTSQDSSGPYQERILYVLPVRGGSGGANSVIQEVVGMRTLGVDAMVATHVKYLKDFERFYGNLLANTPCFVFYESDEDLLAKAADFDVLVATLWSSPAQIAPVAARYPEKLYVYYVQDYEPWFFPNDEKSRAIAKDSYTLIPDMVLMAKTDWICRTVRERHARDVYRVAPSLDHDIYYPPADAAPAHTVRIAAMIRPTTPRRAPLRTLRVLQEVTRRVGANVRMLLFGCEPQDLTTYVRRNAPDVDLNTSFYEARGVLAREGVADLLREADVFVDFSDYQAFGRAGLEAMASGCAVILPAVGGVYEYAVEGENCLIVDTTSSEDMANAVIRLVRDPSLRARLCEHARHTAARFDVTRASLSELSVFRLAGALKSCGRLPATATYRRSDHPVHSASRAVVRVFVGEEPDRSAAYGATIERVLLPLRHRTLRDRVCVHEADTLDDLAAPTSTCIVYEGTIRNPLEAHELVTRCLASGADLVYGVTSALGPPGAGSEERAAAEVLARNAARVVVPSEAIRAQVLRYNSEVAVAPPALDEALWLEDTVHGERIRGDDQDCELRCVILGAGDRPATPLDALVRGALAALDGTLPGGAPALPCDDAPAGGSDPSSAEAYGQRVAQIRAGNRWRIGLLPANDDTGDADLRFLYLAALGCSIICSGSGPHTEIARHRANAIIVDNTPRAWADGLSLLATDHEVRDAIRERAKLDLDTGHLLNRRAPAYLDAYVGDQSSWSDRPEKRPQIQP